MSGAPNNERAAPGVLRVAVLGSGERLEAVLAAVRATGQMEVVGQAGMPAGGGLPDVPWFDDPRAVLGVSEVQAVLLAGSTRRDTEHALLAAERNLPLWRLPPAGRSFAESAEAATRVRRATVVRRIASWWEHVFEHVWRELAFPADFKPLLSEVRLSVRGPVQQSWRANLAEAGGGVLATDGYGLLEALVALRGLPESVVAAAGRLRAASATRETEDTVVAVLRYTGGGQAVLRLGWDLPPGERTLIHHGAAASVTLTDDVVRVADAEGLTIDERPLPAEWLPSELVRFVQFVRGDARDQAAAPLERHLAVSALLDALYLSARTGHPESPHKFYATAGWPEPRP